MGTRNLPHRVLPHNPARFLALDDDGSGDGRQTPEYIEAWRVHDRFFEDDRVVFLPEPAGVEERFREYASGSTASPNWWADAWLLAFARAAEGTLVSSDRALAARGAYCLLLDPGEDS